MEINRPDAAIGRNHTQPQAIYYLYFSPLRHSFSLT
jgi:hypothetical protein